MVNLAGMGFAGGGVGGLGAGGGLEAGGGLGVGAGVEQSSKSNRNAFCDQMNLISSLREAVIYVLADYVR